MARRRKVFVDFHHSSLLRSLIYLFENRLGYDVYRPIGLQWYIEGFWAINNNFDTAKQYLSLGQVPKDNTPALNTPKNAERGVYYCYDPGGQTTNRSCTLEFFKHNKFDYVICSIPAHIPIYKSLIARFQPKAKLIVQIGNEWPEDYFRGLNVLASVKPRKLDANVCFYHQEFSEDIFYPTPNKKKKTIFSFVNVLENMPQAQMDFETLEMLLPEYTFKSYGGQNRDGNMNGPEELAEEMRKADFILHSKPGGDGYGHILHNAFAVGRPVIIRKSHYKGKLAEELLSDGTNLDLDSLDHSGVAEAVRTANIAEMGAEAYIKYKELVDFDKEEMDIRIWLAKM